MDDHLYYWAWREKDNNNSYRNPKRYRVFRAVPDRVHDDPITEAMSKEEAIAYAHRIAKLTGGRILS